MHWLSALTLLILSFTSAQAQRAADYVVISPKRALDVALPVASVKARAELEQRVDRAPPLIVFVPGILGSKLRWAGYVFGEDQIDGKRLVYKTEDKPKPETLNEFIIRALDRRIIRRFSHIDVYGKGLDLLQDLNEGKEIDEFSYDWRADIDESAQALNAWLSQPSRKGKRVFILAHSMGGLVVWRWLQLFEGSARPVTVSHAVFAGSPLQGTCESARMLIEGYKAPTGSPILEELITSAIFSDARAALFTFPSVFQLLPKYDRERACLNMVSNLQIGPAPQNHHKPDFWIGIAGRNSGMKANDARVLGTYANATGLPVEVYEAKVAAAIAAGERFRSNISLRPPRGVQITYLYSDTSQMARSYDIKRDGTGWYEVVVGGSSDKGDGRVLQSSARNDGYNDSERLSLRFALQSVHGALLNDPYLAKFVRDTVQSIVQTTTMQALSILLREDVVSSRLRQGAYIVDPSTDALYVDPATTVARHAIAEYNAKSLVPESANFALTLRAWTSANGVKHDQIETVGRSRLTASLIESSAILDPAATPPEEARFLTEYRLNSGDWKKAYSAARLLEESRSGSIDLRDLWHPLNSSGIVTYLPNSKKSSITPNAEAYMRQTLRNNSLAGGTAQIID